MRTASGQTPDDPYGWIPTRDDYLEWLEVALRFITLVAENVQIFQDAGGASTWPEVFEGLKARYDDLPHQYNPFLDSSDIQKAATLALDAACQLGQLEDNLALIEVKAAIPMNAADAPQMETETDWGATIGGLGNGALLLAALWLFKKDK